MSRPAPQGSKPERFNLKALAIPAYGPALFFGAAEGALLPVIPEMAGSRGAGLALAAFVAMLMNLGSMVFNVPGSLLVARIGERAALLGAGVVAMLGCALALVPNLTALMAGIFLLGMAQAVYLLARMKFLAEAVPVSFRARAMSLLGGATRIGVAIGPFVGAVVVSRWGIEGAVALSVVFLLLAALCALPMVEPHVPGADAPTMPITTRALARRHAPVFLTVGTGVLLTQGVRAIRQVVIPLWCHHIGLSASETSLVYGISGAVDMAVFYPAGKVMDTKGRAAVAVPAMSIMGLSLLAMPLTGTFATALLVSCILGFGNGIGSGMVMTLGADFSPDAGRAVFLGIWRQFGDTGATVGPLLLSGLTALFGLPAAVIVSAIFGFAAAGVLGYYPGKLQREGWGHGQTPPSRNTHQPA